MSIRPIGKRWQVRLRLGAGNRFEQTLPRGATRDDARQLEAQILRTQINDAIGKTPTYLIDEVLDQWQKTGAEKLKSWDKSLKYRFGALKSAYTKGKPLSQLVTVAEKVKADGQRDGTNPVTINRYLALLRRVGNLAERWGWTDLPLGRRVSLLPERSDRHVYLTPAHVQTLIAKADPLLADMIQFAALTGLRRGEMLRLKPEDVRGGLLILEITKNGRPRGVPLPPEALAIARRRLPWGISEHAVWERFKTVRDAVGMPHVRWHDLRHTYASWLVQAGEPLTAVRDLLGHSSLAVTNRYAHLSPENLRATVKKLPKLGVRVGKKQVATKKKKAA